MEKAVVRRGIGAVVLALVAALLLGYLLKGKAPERNEVVKMELPKSPIQIFPEGSAQGQQAQATAGSETNASTAAGVAAAGAGAAVVVSDGAKKASDAGANTGKKLAGTISGKDKLVDPKTGNPSLANSNVLVDGSGQAVFGTKSKGAKDAPANFAFRTTAKKEVRPSVDGKITLNKKKVTKPKPKLVNEKKLPAVGKAKSSKPKKSTKIASSRNKASTKKKKVAVAKKKTAAKRTAPSGRNKYVVQLLATSNASKANGLKSTMKREGYPAYVSSTKRGGKSLYRVRVGSYSGKSAALKKQASMKRRYLKNPYVQSSIVVKN